ENYKVVDYRYANGLALITDLLDASAQKLDAEMQAVNARINILFNYYKIKYVEGRL
ncbi:MAG: TolC family protein, partial [Prevotella sp.]|nr:TolC family protein [Prevotella sp.]